MASMIPSVRGDEAALNSVRPCSGSGSLRRTYGYIAAANSTTSATIAAEELRNAWPGRPLRTARGMFSTAATLSAGTAHSHGFRAKPATASGTPIHVAAVVAA